MAKFKQGNLVLTSTQKITQGDVDVIDVGQEANLTSLQLNQGVKITEITSDSTGVLTDVQVLTAKATQDLVATDLVNDLTPQLGGDLDANFHDINMGDNTISQPEIKDYSETKTSPDSTAEALILDIVNGNVFEVTLTENITTLNFSNPSPAGKSCSFTLVLTQDSTTRTVIWPTDVRWDSGTAPTISTASAVYIFTFMTVDAGTRWYGFLAGSEMAVP